MSIIADIILTVNAGSSSIKLAAFTVDQNVLQLSPILTMTISGIGQPVGILQIVQPTATAQSEEVSAESHIVAARILTERLTEILAPNGIAAIGHRLVHGGVKYASPTLAQDISGADWKLLIQLAPQHTPAARLLVAQFSQQYPSAKQIVCFDTTFFHDLPRIAKIIPIPKKYYAEGVRRYGFHGLSYTSLLDTFREKAGESAANGRVVLAHLGSGASLAATHLGKPVDTTMGFSPISGVVMSTRSGDLDPTVFSFLHRQNNMSIDEFDHMVSHESGLLGVSNVSGDMHTLLMQEGSNVDAAVAIELFVRDVKKAIGLLAATLGGIDSLIFSGGIGEQSALLRSRICKELGYMGIEIDDAANSQNGFLISSGHSRVGVHTIVTNEAQVIAKQANGLLSEMART
jgi:acetate kinase